MHSRKNLFWNSIITSRIVIFHRLWIIFIILHFCILLKSFGFLEVWLYSISIFINFKLFSITICINLQFLINSHQANYFSIIILIIFERFNAVRLIICLFLDILTWEINMIGSQGSWKTFRLAVLLHWTVLLRQL